MQPGWRFPNVPHQALSAFYRELVATVSRIDAAYLTGTLDSEQLPWDEIVASVGENLVLTYRRLSQRPLPRHLPYRSQALPHLLDLVAAEFFRIRVSGVASIRLGPPHRDSPAGANEARTHREGDSDSVGDFTWRILSSAPIEARLGTAPLVILRFDQLLAGRFWGIEFEFEDERVRNLVASQVAANATARMASYLVHLDRLLSRSFVDGEQPLIHIPSSTDRRLEWMIVDILKEDARRAHIALLSEDLHEKTDIRVHYPELQRRRGARVQVTQIADPARHEAKLQRIRHADHYVILSPLSLAEFVNRNEELTESEFEAIWESIAEQKPENVQQLAWHLRAILIGALGREPIHPNGPMAFVPPGIRQLIRVFVRSEAVRSTQSLREHQEAKFKEPVAMMSKPDATAAGRDLVEAEKVEYRRRILESLRVGDVIDGVVTNIADYGVFVDLGGVTGLIHRTALPAAQADRPAAWFARRDTLRVQIIHIDLASERISLRRAEGTAAEDT